VIEWFLDHIDAIIAVEIMVVCALVALWLFCLWLLTRD